MSSPRFTRLALSPVRCMLRLLVPFIADGINNNRSVPGCQDVAGGILTSKMSLGRAELFRVKSAPLLSPDPRVARLAEYLMRSLLQFLFLCVRKYLCRRYSNQMCAIVSITRRR